MNFDSIVNYHPSLIVKIIIVAIPIFTLIAMFYILFNIKSGSWKGVEL